MKKYVILACLILLSACGVRNYTTSTLKPNYTEDSVEVQTILSKSSVIGFYNNEQIKLDFGDCKYSEPIVSDSVLKVYNLKKTKRTYTFSSIIGSERTIRVYEESCKNNKEENIETKIRCNCPFWYLRDDCDYKDWTSYLAFPLMPVGIVGAVFSQGDMDLCEIVEP